MWTKEEWDDCIFGKNPGKVFDEYHNVNYENLTWLATFNITDEEFFSDTDNNYYNCYTSWFIKTQTKLAKALS